MLKNDFFIKFVLLGSSFYEVLLKIYVTKILLAPASKVYKRAFFDRVAHDIGFHSVCDSAQWHICAHERLLHRRVLRSGSLMD